MKNIGNNICLFFAREDIFIISRLLGLPRGTSILGEVRNVEISGATQQLLCNEFHDFPAVFALAHSKINQIA